MLCTFEDGFPSRSAGLHPSIEFAEFFCLGRARQQCDQQRTDSGHGHADHHLLPSGDIVTDGRKVPEERHAKGERHGCDLRRGINAPPEPPKDEDQSGTRTDLHHQVEVGQGVLHLKSEPAGGEHQHHRHDPSQPDLLRVGGLGVDEPQVEVADHNR